MGDVTVMGAGIFGLSVAWSCLRKGASVRVIDPNGVGAGSSGGVVGALAPHTPDLWNTKKEMQFHSLIAAQAYWAEVEAASGHSSGYGRIGRLQPIADERALQFAQERAASAPALWRGKATWEVVPAVAFSSWAPPSPTGLLIHDTLSARLHPRKACAALAAACQAKGAEIVADGPQTGQIVWATGAAGLYEISDALDRLVGNGVKGQAMLLDLDARDQPQLFAAGIHVIPHADGTTAIGSTSERYFDSPTQTDALLEDLHARACAQFPFLGDAAVLERWAALRPRAKTRSPVLGPWPDRDGHFIANGGFKIGFAMASLVGDVMAELLLDGVDNIPDGFRVSDNA